MPVYSEDGNKQVGVVVMIKWNGLDAFHPAVKNCFSKRGELITQPATFDTEEEAREFITRMNTIL